jgi:hypothetical protein
MFQVDNNNNDLVLSFVCATLPECDCFVCFLFCVRYISIDSPISFVCCRPCSPLDYCATAAASVAAGAVGAVASGAGGWPRAWAVQKSPSIGHPVAALPAAPLPCGVGSCKGMWGLRAIGKYPPCPGPRSGLCLHGSRPLSGLTQSPNLRIRALEHLPAKQCIS